MNWVWVVWLVAVGASFAVLERYALRNDTTTLSRFIWTVTKAWPPFPWVVGVVVGFLACHFFWIAQGCDLVK
jgi:hypothetical protein